jgi:hypothetical protein
VLAPAVPGLVYVMLQSTVVPAEGTSLTYVLGVKLLGV